MADNTEILRRRTFAIIAHPDAGKTSLTEKLLLFGGQIQVAGAVKVTRSKDGNFRLDGDRETTWYLGDNFGDGV